MSYTSGRNIIVIGASAGGIEACQILLKELDADIAASVFIVVHLSATGPSLLPRIFGRHLKLTVKNPADKEVPEPGTVYVAPPNRHMLLKPGLIRLGGGPRENGCRPSVDSLFRTAAFSYGAGVIGVILSGALNDGTAGLMTVKSAGGTAIVQDPSEATFPSMPSSALEFTNVDFVLDAKGIGQKLNELVRTKVEIESQIERANREERKYEEGTEGLVEGMDGESSNLTCPACGGALWESEMHNHFKEYKCHVGHSFTAQSLLQAQTDAIDNTFWRTLRQLEENIALRKKMVKWAQIRKDVREADAILAAIALAEKQAEDIRQALVTEIPKLSDVTEP